MGRVCVACGASQSPSLAVFALPRSVHMRRAWLASLQHSISQADWMMGSLLHGVCERHFNPQDIKKGRKSSLNRKAVPLPSNSCFLDKNREDTHSSLTGQLGGTTWQNPDDSTKDPDDALVLGMEDYLPREVTCTDSSECPLDSRSVGEQEDFLEENVCLVCGRDGKTCTLVGLLGTGPLPGQVAMSLLLSRLVGRAKREVLCVSVKICSRCEALVQEVAQLEEDLRVKKQNVKNMFEATLQRQREKVKVIMSSSMGACETMSSSMGACAPLNPCPEKECGDTGLFDSGPVEKIDDSCNFLNNEKEIENSRKTSRRRATVKKYCCPQCHEVYSSLALWVHHLSKHSDTEDLTTQSKARQTASKVKQKHKVGIHTCEECGTTFLSKQNLLAHSSTHQKNWDCSVCGRYLTTKARLKAHLFRFHGIGEEKNKEVVCQDCGKCFGTKAGLRYHRNVVHRVGAEHVCQHCGKVFHYHVPYRSHLLYAHGEKKVVCETCGEKFFTISKLNTHINAVHRSAQSWTCGECQAKFTTHTAYRHHVNVKHLKIHHTCSYCGTQFRKKSSLLLHLWKHSVYICHVCRESFPCGEDLRSHTSAVHGREVGWRGKKKHNPHLLPDKKLAGEQEVALQKTPPPAPPDQHLQQSEHVASIMINDLLMTAESYDNSSLQPFSLSACEKLPEKVVYPEHDQLKVMDASRDLDPTQFGTVEVKSSSPDHMEMAPGVSLINVQILGDMEISQSDTLGDLKNSMLDPEDPTHHHLAVDTRLPEEHLSVAPDLEAPHPLEAAEDHLEVAPLDAAGDHLDSASTIQVPGHLEETNQLESPGHLHLDAPHQCPLPSIITQMEADQEMGKDETACLDEECEGKGSEVNLHKQMDQGEQVDLEPFSVALGGKGEVQYQYVMYISAPGEDSNPG